jgi:hypothetical protein
MSEPVIAREVAEQLVAEMLDALRTDVASDNDREALVEATMDGLFTFDLDSEEGEYIFARPVRLENGNVFDRIKFHELTAGELEHIEKGQRIEVTDGRGFMDLGDMAIKTARFVHKMTGLPIGVCDRIKKRDVAVIRAMISFLS